MQIDRAALALAPNASDARSGEALDLERRPGISVPLTAPRYTYVTLR